MKIENDNSLMLLGLKTNILERYFNNTIEKSIVEIVDN